MLLGRHGSGDLLPGLARSEKTDVAIVGAGIVGLTAAYLLTRAGLSVTVLEARKIGRQVTGRSTAKVTAQHTLIYRYLIDKFGGEYAQLYADANRSGVEQIRSCVDKLGIDCDFEPKDAYVYTGNSSRREELVAEAEAARSLGFKADVLAKAPLPFETLGALRFRDQAQFNPVQYLVGLGAAIAAAGGRIFENIRVTKVDAGEGLCTLQPSAPTHVHSVVETSGLGVGSCFTLLACSNQFRKLGDTSTSTSDT